MRHIYNGDENEITDLTGGVTSPLSARAGIPAEKVSAEQAAAAASTSSNQPPRCVFSYLTQNMCVGELTIIEKCCSSANVAQPFLSVPLSWLNVVLVDLSKGARKLVLYINLENALICLLRWLYSIEFLKISIKLFFHRNSNCLGENHPLNFPLERWIFPLPFT